VNDGENPWVKDGENPHKSLLKSFVRRLPWGAKQALLEGTIGSLGRFVAFQQIGHALGVESVSIRGKNGLAWGSLNDSGLLGNYSQRREWSPQMIKLFQHFFSMNSGGTYLDIGANIGLTLFPLAQNPNVQCYAFEPEPRNFGYLNQGLHENCTATISSRISSPYLTARLRSNLSCAQPILETIGSVSRRVRDC
jgi:hypothetical protein